jgi:hypothetical protein
MARTAAAQARLAQAVASLPAILDRLIPMARRLVGFFRTITVLTAIAAAAMVASIAVISRPSTWGASIAVGVVALILTIPVLILKWFRDALIEVIELPDWLRSAPELMRTHGAEVARIVAQTRGDRRGTSVGGRTHLFRDVLSSGKLLLAAHKDLPEYGTALRLINPPFLLAVAVSLVAAVIEWFLAFGLVVVMLLSLAFG